MPFDERYPTPLRNVSPAGWAGFGAVIVMGLGIWSLFGNAFLIALALMGVVALGTALAIRRWRLRHPSDESLLHLDPGQENGKASPPPE